MEKGRQGGDNIFESSNAFGGFGDFGGFGFHRSKMPSIFGGRDPFDDPFFTRPFDSIFGPSSTSSDMYQKTSRDKGIVIEELDSEHDQEKEDKNSGSTIEPSVEHPDDDVEAERTTKSVRNDHYKVEPPKAGKSSFQTCRVTYGGIDGTYCTSTRTRRIGDDGAILEESQEADKTTGEATHRISRGIHDKGHSLTRKLNSDGKVDTMQTLHNLDEDELAGFEEAWKSNNSGQGLGWKGGCDVYRSESSSSGDNRGNQVWGGWSLPSLEQQQQQQQARRSAGFGFGNETSSNHGGRTKKVVRINID